jgi:UDP-N-acetylmuramate dehydrogenase
VSGDLLHELRVASGGEVLEGLALAPRTSVRVGGDARIFVRPKDPASLVAVLKVLRAAALGWHSLGGGANTIVGDGGIDGVVLKLGPGFAEESIEEGGDHVVLMLGAGAPSVRLLQVARNERCVGVAWVAGIPGTIGGLVAMNAGTKTGCMADHVLAVEVASADGLRWIDAPELRMAYRRCELPAGSVLVRARCRVRRGTEAELRVEARNAADDLEKRRLTQPLTQPNSGSVFMNPPGDFAGRLIEAVGLKGQRQGGAQISERHANFIVNLGNAKAADVVELIALARRTVREQYAIELHPEVKLVGTFTPPLPEELRPFATPLGRAA